MWKFPSTRRELDKPSTRVSSWPLDHRAFDVLTKLARDRIGAALVYTSLAVPFRLGVLSFQKVRGLEPRRAAHSRALALAAAIYLTMAGPALADFKSAVSAYERGAYQEAQAEFEALAAEGDERAGPYLELISERLVNELRQRPVYKRQPAGSFLSSLKDSISSIIRESFESSDSGSSAARSMPERTSPSTPAVDRPNSLSHPGRDAAPAPSRPNSFGQRQRSIWSVGFFLPGDATLAALQYGAQLVGAVNLRVHLQVLSRSGDKLVLGILAAFWWVLIFRALVSIGNALCRLAKAAMSKSTTPVASISRNRTMDQA